MDKELQALDKVKWNSQEDDLLSKLYKHFANDFVQISNQMNNIYFYSKMTPALCEYRWKYYIDGNINRSDFNGYEEAQMFHLMKRNDLYTNSFWFELSDQFNKRPPSVLKQCTMKFILRYLNILNDAYVVNKHAKKKYTLRIKAFTIDIMMTFFRLGKERIKRSGPPTLLVQAIEQCNQLLTYIEQMIATKGTISRYEDQSDQAQQRFFTMIECLIFIDTIYKIYHKIAPYNQGEQAERDRLESLVYNKKLSTQSFAQDDKGFDDHAYEQLSKEDIRLIYNSDALLTFQQYFTTVE